MFQDVVRFLFGCKGYLSAMIKKFLPWIIGLFYLAFPFDIVPDVLVGPGWLDDLVVLGLAYWWYSRIRQPYQEGSNYRPSGSAAGTGQTWQEHASRGGPGQESRQESDRGPAQEEDPYKILGLRPGASQEEIKTAYKKLAAQYHPDKVQHLGEEFQELAHEKFVIIQNAYNRLTKS
jgi:uncharacterized membrane protein YkvA (DUF1232 family)